MKSIKEEVLQEKAEEDRKKAKGNIAILLDSIQMQEDHIVKVQEHIDMAKEAIELYEAVKIKEADKKVEEANELVMKNIKAEGGF